MLIIAEKCKFFAKKTEKIDVLHEKFCKHIKANDFQKRWQGVIPDYKTVIGQHGSFGEYWSKNFFDGYDKNTLVLYDNGGISDIDTIYTLFHEVYPGHGNFFEIIKRNKRHIDLGSSLLIEGWATFCEMSVSYDNNYRAYYKNTYYNLLKCSISHNYENNEYAENTLIDYPLFEESYCMGMILLKSKIQSDDDILKFYKKLLSQT